MCGIAGILAKGTLSERLPGLVAQMKEALDHRGPDDSGSHVEGGWGFVNLRLAIVDIAGGHQPMYTARGTIGIVYNGEVYNHHELRLDLEAKGHVFETSSDTEVILRLFETYRE